MPQAMTGIRAAPSQGSIRRKSAGSNPDWSSRPIPSSDPASARTDPSQDMAQARRCEVPQSTAIQSAYAVSPLTL
jgi:hypothetical protein